MVKIVFVFLVLFSSIFAAEHQVVVDKKNNIVWQDTPDAEKEAKWMLAKSYCKGLNLLGQNDWRLPTIKELHLAAKMTKEKKFRHGTDTGYWSSEEDQEDDINAMALYLKRDHLYSDDKCESAHIRCVRTTFEK
jgi:formylglycine-generating enzyme required for sulfatase activity